MANEKRLIDLNDIFPNRCFYVNANDPEKSLDELISRINNAPTVDAVEVVHGYWIDSYSVDHIGRIIEHSIDCSVCDSVFKDDSRQVVKHWKERFKACPFCGAVMDGDGNGAAQV